MFMIASWLVRIRSAQKNAGRFAPEKAIKSQDDPANRRKIKLYADVVL